MIYVVTGHPRSGTSMMMAALRAGGMDVAYSEEREQRIIDKALPQASGFNPSGIWELSSDVFRSTEWPWAYDHRLVKLLWSQLCHLKLLSPGYRVVVMRRHPEEVHQSYEAAIGGRRLQIRHNYGARFGQIMAQLQAHPCVKSVDIMDYSLVVSYPYDTLLTLEEAGWPIDASKACEVVDPSLYRFRVGETIVEGA